MKSTLICSDKHKMERDKFSIVVPVYNVEKYVGDCISSILAQTYPHFELILVDDGSTDESGNICDRYAAQDYRIKVIHQANGGVSRARNKGIEAATGQWICFIDSDDEVKPGWLEHHALNADADMLVQGMLETYPGGEKRHITVPDLYVKWEDYQTLHVREYDLYSPIKCFKAEIIWQNNLRFIEDMHSAEDLTFVLDFMSQSDSIRFIPYEGYVYNHQNSTLTGRSYSPNLILDWHNKLLAAALKTCNGNQSSTLYKSIAEHQFGNLSQYVTFKHKDLSRSARYSLYKALRELYGQIDFRHLKWTRLIFALLPLPLPLFDGMIRMCSCLYKNKNTNTKK